MEGFKIERSGGGKSAAGAQGSRPPRPYPATLEQLLTKAVEQGASDLHLTSGVPPVVRIHGELVHMDYPVLTGGNLEALIGSVLDEAQKESLFRRLELDFSYTIPGLSRFRGNIMHQVEGMAAAFRLVPLKPPELGELGLPHVVRDLCFLSRGLILVTGPTGNGKSTTLAAMINLMNRERKLNIITIEDPVEFLHQHGRSIVRQREVGTDTHSFAEALRHALRHDPDVILVGEMRDLDSISIALTAAETGHLVLSTLHTQNAPLTVNRIVDVFSDHMRNQIRQQLSGSIQAILGQQLLPRADGKGRVLATEVLIATPAVRNLIREGKEHQLYGIIQTNRQVGMQTLDQALAELCWNGKITRETAFQRCLDTSEFERFLEARELAGFLDAGESNGRNRKSRPTA